MNSEAIKNTGYVPGGEDRTQWIFEGNDWSEILIQLIIEQITPYIKAYREKYGFDMVNWLRFSYADGILSDGTRVFYITRRSWRYVEQAHGVLALRAKVREILERDRIN